MFNRIVLKSLCVVPLWLHCSALAAAEPDAPPVDGWTPAAIVQHVLESNPLLRAAQTAVDQAEGRRLQAGRWDNPELRLSYAGDQAFQDAGEQRLTIGLSQRFPVTNRLKLEKAMARDEIKLARVEIANEANRLRQETELAVVALAHTEAELRLREEWTELNREFLAFIESRIETGEASRVEADQLRIALYSIEQEVGHLKNLQHSQKGVILQLMGLEPDRSFRLSYAFELPESALELPAFSDDQLLKHPAYQVRKIVLELSESSIASALAARWADVAVEVFFEDGRSLDDPGGLERDRFLGLGVSVPLPLLNRHRGQLAERRALRSEMRWRLEATAARLRSEAARERELIGRLYTQASHYEAAVTSLVEQNLKEMQAAYAQGQISLSELFRAQEQRLKIQSTHLRMLRQWEEAQINWSAATANVETVTADTLELSNE